MSNIRFLDQVPLSAYQVPADPSTGQGSYIPRIIYGGETFTVTKNTSIATFRLTVVGKLVLELGPELELPDGSTARANSYLWVEDRLDNQGTIDIAGIIEFGENSTFASATII